MTVARRRRTDFDVAVVGGGLAGATTAALLQEAGRSVVMLDQRVAPEMAADAPFALRVSTLSVGSRRILEAAGAWSRLQEARIASFDRMVVWEAGGGDIEFASDPSAKDPLGYVVENDAAVSALRNAAADVGVDVRVPAELEDLRHDEAQSELTLVGGTTLRVRLVVAADGPASRTRSLAGIDSHVEDYEQSGVVAVLRGDGAGCDCAWQRFVQDGTVALLPLPQNHWSLVWSTTDSEPLMALADDPFSRRVSEAMQGRLGRLCVVGERGSFPLRYLQAARYIAPGVALVGDAAHVVHPLAGQGANLGLADAAALAETLLEVDPEALGGTAALRPYERWRRSENIIAGRFLDLLQRGFSVSGPWSRNLRGRGLDVVDRIAPLKDAFATLAAGTGPGAPAVARR